jgi:hypothetical protein
MQQVVPEFGTQAVDRDEGLSIDVVDAGLLPAKQYSSLENLVSLRTWSSSSLARSRRPGGQA